MNSSSPQKTPTSALNVAKPFSLPATSVTISSPSMRTSVPSNVPTVASPIPLSHVF